MPVVPVSTEEFRVEVLDSNVPVLVDFWATWCGPCRMVAPILDKLAEKYENRVKFVKVDVDKNPSLAQQYAIMSIPTLIIFKDGQPFAAITGAQPKEIIESVLTSAL